MVDAASRSRGVVSRVRLLWEAGVAVWHKAAAHSSNARAQNDNFTLILYAKFSANSMIDVDRPFHQNPHQMPDWSNGEFAN